MTLAESLTYLARRGIRPVVARGRIRVRCNEPAVIECFRAERDAAIAALTMEDETGQILGHLPCAPCDVCGHAYWWRGDAPGWRCTRCEPARGGEMQAWVAAPWVAQRLGLPWTVPVRPLLPAPPETPLMAQLIEAARRVARKYIDGTIRRITRYWHHYAWELEQADRDMAAGDSTAVERWERLWDEILEQFEHLRR